MTYPCGLATGGSLSRTKPANLPAGKAGREHYGHPAATLLSQVRQILGGRLDHDVHTKHVNSLSDATVGMLRSASLAVCTIGQGLAAARGLTPKHATKQVDLLLSNSEINVDDIIA